MNARPPADRLIVALDQPTLEGALVLRDRLHGVVERYKVGLELFSAVGPRMVEVLRERGERVFLDLKFHDIPETVRRSARVASSLGAEWITVHAAGGEAMLSAAVEGAREGGATKVIAVTVLTSLDLNDLARVGTAASSIEELVVLRATRAQQAGCGGVVASVREARAIRGAVGEGFLIVTPGVRANGLAAGSDQKRTATVSEAIESGADAVVVGRPISQAQNPRAAALAFLEELRFEDKR